MLAVYGENSAISLIRNDNNGGGGTASRVSFHAEQFATYYFAVDGAGPADSGSILLAWSLTTEQGQAGLFSAILPSTRSVQIGQTATAFGILINSTDAATKCYLQQPNPGMLGEISFRATTPANTIDTAFGPNEAVDIPAGGARNFVFALTPESELPAIDLTIVFDCENKQPAPLTPGVNTFTLTATPTAGPDLIAIGLSPSGDGIVNVPGNTGTGFFAASAVNIGAAGAITANVDTGHFPIPISAQVTLCETNPANGQCLSPPAATTTRTFATNDIGTYTIFVQGTGNIPFNPGVHRLYLRLKDANGLERGATSVAVRTQ